MKNVIFLGSRQFGEKNDVATLARECGRRIAADEQVTVRAYYFEDLVFHISNQKRTITNASDGADVADADLVIAMNWYPARTSSLRDLAYTVALYLLERQVPFWNREMLQQRSSTKLSALWQLSQLGIAIPETYFSLNRDALLEVAPNSQLIVKDIAISRGRRNYLAASPEALRTLLQGEPTARFMTQTYIPNDFDLRVVCFDSQPSLVIKRQRQMDATHLNNTSQGATATVLGLDALPVQVQADIAHICARFGRDNAGIDYIVSNDGSERYICLEVNPIPQLTSGSFTTLKFDQLTQAIVARIGKETS